MFSSTRPEKSHKRIRFEISCLCSHLHNFCAIRFALSSFPEYRSFDWENGKQSVVLVVVHLLLRKSRLLLWERAVEHDRNSSNWFHDRLCVFRRLHRLIIEYHHWNRLQFDRKESEQILLCIGRQRWCHRGTEFYAVADCISKKLNIDEKGKKRLFKKNYPR